MRLSPRQRFVILFITAPGDMPPTVGALQRAFAHRFRTSRHAALVPLSALRRQGVIDCANLGNPQSFLSMSNNQKNFALVG